MIVSDQIRKSVSMRLNVRYPNFGDGEAN